MRKLSVIFFLIPVLLVTCFEQEGYARKKKKTEKAEKETPYQKLFKNKAHETVRDYLLFTRWMGRCILKFRWGC